MRNDLAIVLVCVLAGGCGSVTAAGDAGGDALASDGGGGGSGGGDALDASAPDTGGGVEHPPADAAPIEHAPADALPIEHAPETRTPNPALNLLPNGDFANGLTGGWNVTPIGTPANAANGQLCTTLTPNTRVYIGWGPTDPAKPLMLAGSTRLLFSYKASTTANLLVFTPQVGHTSAPFTAVFTQPEVVPVGALTTISREFVVPAAGDTSAGIVFQAEAATAATVCVDDVYLGPP